MSAQYDDLLVERFGNPDALLVEHGPLWASPAGHPAPRRALRALLREVFLPRRRTPTADWRTDAACAGTDPRLFDSYEKGSAQQALSYCLSCPVIRECRLEARATTRVGVAPSGVWGGQVYKDGHIVADLAA